MNNYSVMEYLYRDANNFKAWGKILLSGTLTNNDVTEIKTLLDFGEYFVAEEVDIPVLYQELWKFSNGPTVADHAYHEYAGLHPATDDDLSSTPLWGEVTSLIQKFRDIEGRWDCSKSVHYNY
ncbi:MAG: hypothetical protein KAS48_08440 [Gammaproteobacteria bacterium]|nr:hypothetical protein [Gammaproteobacteria bacterium]